MANPQVPQGTLNRLRASVVIPQFPQLNVTAAFLGEEAIRLSFEGESTTFINTLTGAVTSPEPYIAATVSINLLKTQQLANLYKRQMEQSAILGDLTIRPDASTLNPYLLENCAIESVPELNFGGRDAAYRVVIKGFYIVNNILWNS